MSSQPPVWLITGCSSGFGLELARTVLSHNHLVIATSRSPAKTPDLVAEIESQGGRWLKLDITSPEAEVREVVKQTREIFGRIDFLVNNAGVGLVGGLEDFTEDDVRPVFETNVFGAFKVTRAVLPIMREQKSGWVVNVSSRSGFEGLPGFSLYAASKFAVEGMTESLAAEYAPFGIRVLLVEPGLFRTGFPFAGRETLAFYQETPVADMLERLEKGEGREPGDPKKAAERFLGVATGEGMGQELEGYLRVVLGENAQMAAVKKAERLRENFEACEEIARSADFASLS